MATTFSRSMSTVNRSWPAQQCRCSVLTCESPVWVACTGVWGGKAWGERGREKGLLEQLEWEFLRVRTVSKHYVQNCTLEECISVELHHYRKTAVSSHEKKKRETDDFFLPGGKWSIGILFCFLVTLSSRRDSNRVSGAWGMRRLAL